MTRLLEKALQEASKLPPGDQDALAAILLEELSSEKRWAEQFSGSQDKLSALADEAIGELRRGKAEPFDPEADL